jgi:hypothetical protein
MRQREEFESLKKKKKKQKNKKTTNQVLFDNKH